jgi:N utilization substance protein B
MDLLFEADQRQLDPLALLAQRIVNPLVEAAVPQYAADIVEGVSAHRDRIDELLETYSQGWTIDRMPAVDRELLRIGAWEIIYNADVPQAVAIDEAADLAAQLSTDDSPAFVTGLLNRIAEIAPTLLD